MRWTTCGQAWDGTSKQNQETAVGLVHCPRLRPLRRPCISYTNQASYQCIRLASSLRHSQRRDMRSLALIC